MMPEAEFPKSEVRDLMRLWWDRRATADAFHYVETTFWKGRIDEFFELGERRASILIDPLLERHGLRQGLLTAIDLGCGVGRFTRALSKRFQRVIGIDVSPKMIERAIELHPAAEYPNVSFCASDGVSLPIEDGVADFVFSYEVFQHMPSRSVIQSTLHDVARVLTSRGYGYLHFHTGAHPRLLSRSRLGAIIPIWARPLLGLDPLAGDPAFRGTPPLSYGELLSLTAAAQLQLRELLPDPTHQGASKMFVLVTRDATRI